MNMTNSTFAANGRRRSIALGAATEKLAYALVWAIVLFLVLTPITSLVFGSFRSSTGGAAAGWTLENWAGLGSTGIANTIWNTLFIAVTSAAGGTVLGAFFAWVVYRTDFRHGKLFTAIIAISFILPGFILAMAWIILGSPGGIINSALRGLFGPGAIRINIHSIWGIVWVQILSLAPIAFFFVRGPMLSTDSSLEESAYVAGANGRTVLRRITFPLMFYPLLSSFLMSFILAVEQFAIPAMLGIPSQINVLVTQLYLLISFQPQNPGLAAAIGLLLSALCALGLYFHRRVMRKVNDATISGKSYRMRPLPLGKARWLVNCICALFALSGCIFPLIAILYTSVIRYSVANPFQASYTLRAYTAIFNDPNMLRSFWNTLVVSGGGALFALVLAGLIAYFVQRRKMVGHRTLELLAFIPFGIPGVVVGLGFLWSYVYLPIYGTLLALVLAYTARFLPYAIETVGAQLRQIHTSLDEAASVAGGSPYAVLQRILVPLLRPALQSAYFLLFVTFFREISVAALIYTPTTQVISISTWTYFENADWGRASALSVLTTVVIVGVMAFVLRDKRRAPVTPK